MRHALALAERAAAEGEVPVGAVLVHEGALLAEGYNRPIIDHDPSGHAEMIALRAAAKVLGNYRLKGTTLYVTLEPCVMCAGAAHWAQLGAVVFGADEPKTGYRRYGALLHRRTAVRGGVRAEECAALLRNFFKFKRE